jgi:hypothetical protein
MEKDLLDTLQQLISNSDSIQTCLETVCKSNCLVSPCLAEENQLHYIQTARMHTKSDQDKSKGLFTFGKEKSLSYFASNKF